VCLCRNSRNPVCAICLWLSVLPLLCVFVCRICAGGSRSLHVVGFDGIAFNHVVSGKLKQTDVSISCPSLSVFISLHTCLFIAEISVVLLHNQYNSTLITFKITPTYSSNSYSCYPYMYVHVFMHNQKCALHEIALDEKSIVLSQSCLLRPNTSLPHKAFQQKFRLTVYLENIAHVHPLVLFVSSYLFSCLLIMTYHY